MRGGTIRLSQPRGVPEMSRTGPFRLAMTVAAALGLSAAVAGPVHAMGSGGDSASTAPSSTASGNYDRGVAAVEDGRYRDAIALMQKVVHEDPSNADAYNYLGFSHRKLGEYDPARTYYAKALDIEPDHVRALEYLGELYVETGDMAAAEETLARIEAVCGRGCAEYAALNRRIAEAQGN